MWTDPLRTGKDTKKKVKATTICFEKEKTLVENYVSTPKNFTVSLNLFIYIQNNTS